jgi:hypothetical protein
VIELFAGKVFVFIFHPSVAWKPSHFLDFPTETPAASPVLLVNPVLADAFRINWMGQPGHPAVIDKGVEVAFVKFPLRIVDFL